MSVSHAIPELRGVHALVLSFLTLALCLESARATQSNATSAAKAPYAESMRSSQYVAVRDGTRLAIDVYRPVLTANPWNKLCR